MVGNLHVVMAAVALVVVEGCEPGWGQAAPASDQKALPAPRREGGPSLASVLATRRSTRSFAGRDLDDAELGQLLWAGQGVTDGHRSAPSAGALYPITLRVADRTGIWRYVPADHALVRESAADRRSAIATSSFSQETVRAAPAILIVTADVTITARKYGGRAERYATLEAGHVAQNVLLEATALGLGAVPVGAFEDGALRRALGLAATDLPLYLIPVGAPP
ncbi:MAG TPA: SagB/ThcOx family dehydrogenase [Kofleriaceae bacterium]